MIDKIVRKTFKSNIPKNYCCRCVYDQLRTHWFVKQIGMRKFLDRNYFAYKSKIIIKYICHLQKSKYELGF